MLEIFSCRCQLVQSRCLRTLKLTQYLTALPQHCLQYHKNFEVVGKKQGKKLLNVLHFQRCCTPAAPIYLPKAELRQLGREAKLLFLPGQSSRPSLYIRADFRGGWGSDHIESRASTYKNLTAGTECILCNLPCPLQPVTFSKKYSGRKMEIVNQAIELFENNLFQREYRLQILRRWDFRAEKCIQRVNVVMKLVLHCLENSKISLQGL